MKKGAWLDSLTFHQVVAIFIEKEAGNNIDIYFTDEAFEPCGFEQSRDNQQRQQPPVSGKQLRKQCAEIDHFMLKPQGGFAPAPRCIHCYGQA
ncbi:hypothetical protein JYT48_02420 [Mariprofundus ferrooxydans]|nr:hypothetical protein [Mariprofundus ferrooxydans]MBN4077105.1 hypothetical protein [Mariprofundus ferrooxydans]